MVATPIGNLGDLGPRAGATLGAVDVIAAEDTRQTRRLLEHLGIDTPMVALHDHNERQALPGLVRQLEAGRQVALVSDAGTPLISDPGFRLVRAARGSGIDVIAIPGPCAAVAALSSAGLPTDRFAFEGFVASRSAARCRQFEAVSSDPRTLIYYVPPRDLRATLADASACFGSERTAAVVREISKVFEQGYCDTLEGLVSQASRDANMARGEVVLLIGGAPAATDTGESRQTMRVLLESGLALKQAVDIAMKLTGDSRNSLYQQGQTIKDEISAND
ncbi:MAG: 16S rRNA (cytidine(1402)-2'-O)-methyltransferase [Gammaproteobacteria bacterium]|nr:16S rRNA (cytidine(1402)-2'-O)-methyltransferase [Gammaproteobacteria bacterium]